MTAITAARVTKINEASKRKRAPEAKPQQAIVQRQMMPSPLPEILLLESRLVKVLSFHRRVTTHAETTEYPV